MIATFRPPANGFKPILWHSPSCIRCSLSPINAATGIKLLSGRLAHDVQIGMRAGKHLSAGRTMFAGIEQFRRPRLAKQRLRQFQRKRALADSARPDEQKRARQPSAVQCPAESFDHVVMSNNAVPGHGRLLSRCRSKNLILRPSALASSVYRRAGDYQPER